MLNRKTRHHWPRRVVSLVALSATLTGCTPWGSYQDIADVRAGARIDFSQEEMLLRQAGIKANFERVLGLNTSTTSVANLAAAVEVLKAEPLLFANPGKEKAAALLYIGYDYVDQKCTEYFLALLHIQRDAGATSKQFAILGTAAAAMLALAGGGPLAVGIAAAATGAAVATTDNVASDLLFAIDAGTTRDLTFRALRTYSAAEGAQADRMRSYAQVYNTIGGYARLCTPPQIESLVKEALIKAKPTDIVSSPAPTPDRKALDAAVGLVLSSAGKKIGLDNGIDIEDAKLLHVLLIGDGNVNGDGNEKIRAEIHRRLNLNNAMIDQNIFDASKDPPVVKLTAANRDQLKNGLSTAAALDVGFATSAAKLFEEIKNTVNSAAAPAAAAPAAAAPPAGAPPAGAQPSQPSSPATPAPDYQIMIPDIHIE